MTHEPECQALDESPGLRPGACVLCHVSRLAYQRGRKDAAAAVESMNPHGWLAPDGEEDWWIDWFEAQRTALGNSEQA